MLYIETQNEKEQSILEQQFHRDGNIFEVPLNKTNQIQSLLQTFLFQINGDTQQQNIDERQKNQCRQLIDKIITFISSNLHLHFSFQRLKEIIHIVKKQSRKLTLYQNYIIHLNQILCDNDLNSSKQKQPQQQNNKLHQLQQQFQAILTKKKPGTLNSSGGQINLDEEVLSQQFNDKHKNMENAQIMSLQQNYYNDEEKTNQDASTMHTLKKQVSNSNFAYDILSNDSNQVKLDSSLNCYDTANEDIEMSNQCTQTIQNENYIPPPSPQCTQKKMKDLFASNKLKKQPSNNANNGNGFMNISGKFHPIPSFLNDKSLNQLIAKQTIEEQKGSNGNPQKIKHEVQKQLPNGPKYTDSIKNIRYRNKISRYLKSNLALKKNINNNQQNIGKYPLNIINRQLNQLERINQVPEDSKKIISSDKFKEDGYMKKIAVNQQC